MNLKGKKIVITPFKCILFLVYMVEISNFYIGYTEMFQLFKYISICVIGIYLAKRYNIFLKRKYIKLNGILVLFCFFTIVVSYFSVGNYERNPLLAAIVFSLIQLETVLVMEYAAEKGRMKYVLDSFFKTTVIWLLITDFMILFIPNLFLKYDNYLVGTKFIVSYLHILLISFAIINYRLNILKNKMVIALIFLLSTYITVKVECSTGLVGEILLIILLVLPYNLKKIFYKPISFTIAVILSFLFSVIYEIVLANPLIQNLVEIYLSKELTLTGRIYIYAMLPKVLKGHYMMGYGYGTTYEVCEKYIGFADTQNAVTEWIMQIGIVGVIILMIIFCKIFSKVQECIKNDVNNEVKKYAVLIDYIYILVILGTVEITIDNIFWGVMALIFGGFCQTLKEGENSL